MLTLIGANRFNGFLSRHSESIPSTNSPGDGETVETVETLGEALIHPVETG
jgi:hypothetical protein